MCSGSGEIERVVPRDSPPRIGVEDSPPQVPPTIETETIVTDCLYGARLHARRLVRERRREVDNLVKWAPEYVREELEEALERAREHYAEISLLIHQGEAHDV